MQKGTEIQQKLLHLNKIPLNKNRSAALHIFTNLQNLSKVFHLANHTDNFINFYNANIVGI